jgi:hypothetical protein
MAEHKFCQKLDRSSPETFQMMRQMYNEDPWAVVLCLSDKRFAQGRDILEDIEHTAQPRKVRTKFMIQRIAMLMHANSFQMVNEVTAAAAAAAVVISHGTCQRILYDDLNKSHFTQHSVPLVMTQGQRNVCMSICRDLIYSADKDGTFLN